MSEILCAQIKRRLPFRLEHLPWLGRIYRFPFDRFDSLTRQLVFGAPNLALVMLLQRLCPFAVLGSFSFDGQAGRRLVPFDAKNTQFSALYLRMFEHGYEPQASALVDLLVPDEGVFLDVGSNWGWFSLLVASRPGFRGKIHAFEPMASTYADLKGVVREAGCDQIIECHQVALSASSGSGTMQLPDGLNSGQATLVLNSSPNGAATQSSICVRAMDDVVSGRVDFIKIDAEGHESQVLLGAKRVLGQACPYLLIENGRSTHLPGKALRPLEILEEYGYSLFHMSWLKAIQGRFYLTGDDHDPDPQEVEQLALVPLQPHERFLHHDGMNIFACHQSRMSELLHRFQSTRLRPGPGASVA